MTWWPWPSGWPWPIWPLILTHVIFDLDPCGPWPPILPVSLSNEAISHVFWPGDLDLWPTTLTFRVDLEVIHVHALTKFHSPRCNGSWDMNFVLVTDIQKAMHMSPPCMRTGGLKNADYSNGSNLLLLKSRMLQILANVSIHTKSVFSTLHLLRSCNVLLFLWLSNYPMQSHKDSFYKIKNFPVKF